MYHLASDFLFPLQPPTPPPPSRQTPWPSHPRELDFGPFRVRLGLFWVCFGSVSGLFRVCFGSGSVSGPFRVLGGVGVGSGRGASVREKISLHLALEQLFLGAKLKPQTNHCANFLLRKRSSNYSCALALATPWPQTTIPCIAHTSHILLLT